MSGPMKNACRIIASLLEWYDSSKRTFPFRGTRDPYRIWLSEIMLQQTRTETVGPYYERFLALFPDVFALARAGEEQVLKAWEGLGYYTRARNLHRTARRIAQEAGGSFPNTAAGLLKLPGIGVYTAAAIASIAYDEPIPAMDGNLNRVISRLYHIEEDIGNPQVKRALYDLGLALMPPVRAGDMNQALMDLGATICLPGTPDCECCPLSAECLSLKTGDPSGLPVMKAKKQPLIIPVSVTLLFCRGRVLLVSRREALLRGLYVFLLNEGDATPEGALNTASQFAVGVKDIQEIGAARHVFTHRVWQMRIYRGSAEDTLPAAEGIWADASDILALPLPGAMRTAREYALEILDEMQKN